MMDCCCWRCWRERYHRCCLCCTSNWAKKWWWWRWRWWDRRWRVCCCNQQFLFASQLFCCFFLLLFACVLSHPACSYTYTKCKKGLYAWGSQENSWPKLYFGIGTIEKFLRKRSVALAFSLLLCVPPLLLFVKSAKFYTAKCRSPVCWTLNENELNECSL